jgi:hypothetical protein
MRKGIVILFMAMAALLFMGAAVNTAIVDDILTIGVGGISVAALTQIIKKFVEKTFRFEEAWLGLVISLMVSITASAIYMIGAGWSTSLFVVYSVLTWAVANGFFKITHREKT